MDERTQESPLPRLFDTTEWGVVQAAGAERSEGSRYALETLCNAYWYPIYTYVRRKGHNADDAQDLTQEFFSQIIAKQHLRLADPQRGRFRSFLLASLDYFLAREWCRAHRQKRGGQYRFVSLDEEMSEDVPQFEAINGENPEKTFRRQWALAVLKQTMDALENECATLQKERLFREVKHLLYGERDGETYAAIGARLSMTESNVRVAVHRLRRRYGELLRAEIARTVDSDDEVEEELRYLLQALCE